MAIVVKPKYVQGTGLTWHDDGTYGVEELWTVTGLPPAASGTEIGNQVKAIEAATAASEDLYPQLHQDTELLQATARLLSDDHAEVTLSWGINDTPVLDGAWVCESSSDSVRESKGLDVNNDPITIEYVNATMLARPAPQAALTKAEFFAIWGNKKRFQRGITVPSFYNRPHIQARRQVSKYKAERMSVHPNRWPAKYVDYVNYEIPKQHSGDGTVLVPAGVFRCASMRVYTRNRGESLFIDAEFVLDKLGHEHLAVFADTDGLIPGDVDISANMKKPWPPEAADRYSTAGAAGDPTGGAARPQTLKGRATFHNPPFNLNLEPFYAA